MPASGDQHQPQHTRQRPRNKAGGDGLSQDIVSKHPGYIIFVVSYGTPLISRRFLTLPQIVSSLLSVALSLVPPSTMIVYKDLISGDEMMTDAFPQKPVLDSEGNTVEGMFEVRGHNENENILQKQCFSIFQSYSCY